MELRALVAHALGQLLAVLLDARRERAEVLDGLGDGLRERQSAFPLPTVAERTYAAKEAHRNYHTARSRHVSARTGTRDKSGARDALRPTVFSPCLMSK
jgi:hypothetical protein